MMRPQLLAVILLSLFVGTAPAQNENEDEPRHKEFVSLLKKKYFQVGALVQVFADFQTERTKGRNGFSIANLRWKVDGEFDDGYGYAFEMSFTRSPAILDARLHYAFDPAFTADLGLFKPPFSKQKFFLPAWRSPAGRRTSHPAITSRAATVSQASRRYSCGSIPFRQRGSSQNLHCSSSGTTSGRQASRKSKQTTSTRSMGGRTSGDNC